MFESGAPKREERFQTGHEAAGPGKAAPGLELDAFLQVPTAERLTPYLSAIRITLGLPGVPPASARAAVLI